MWTEQVDKNLHVFAFSCPVSLFFNRDSPPSIWVDQSIVFSSETTSVGNWANECPPEHTPILPQGNDRPSVTAKRGMLFFANGTTVFRMKVWHTSFRRSSSCMIDHLHWLVIWESSRQKCEIRLALLWLYGSGSTSSEWWENKKANGLMTFCCSEHKSTMCVENNIRTEVYSIQNSICCALCITCVAGWASRPLLVSLSKNIRPKASLQEQSQACMQSQCTQN